MTTLSNVPRDESIHLMSAASSAIGLAPAESNLLEDGREPIVLVDTPELVVPSPALAAGQRLAKRTFDIVAASLLLLLLAPAFVIITIAVRLSGPGPIIFRQTRQGRGGRPFTFLKFRSMVADAEAQRDQLEQFNEADGPIFKMRDDPRITRVGRILRTTSLDELPQLWNVICGEMTLVGPRPPIPSEVLRYERWQRDRLLVTPGITGLWQVSGRSELSFDEMVTLDLEYIARWSFWLDLTILVRTVTTVIGGRGAY